MLDFDGQSLDPAIVLAQPMKPGSNMEMPPMVCQPGTLILAPHGCTVCINVQIYLKQNQTELLYCLFLTKSEKVFLELLFPPG